MAHPPYLRDKARELRVERRLSVVEIADRLALPKTTVFHWVRDLALARPRRAGPLRGTRAMQRKYRLAREEAYEAGRRSFEALRDQGAPEEQQRAARGPDVEEQVWRPGRPYL